MSWKNSIWPVIVTDKKNRWRWNTLALAAFEAVFACEFKINFYTHGYSFA